MMKRGIWVFLLLLPLGLMQAQIDSAQWNKLKFTVDLITTAYVDSVNQPKLIEDAINGMLKKLDPHSVYIPSDKVERANEGLNGSFEGIGIEYSIMNDTLYVTGVIPTGPAEKVGLLAGDKIVKVDSENIAGINLGNEGVSKRLRGKKGSRVQVFVLRRANPELLMFDITRDKIPIFSVVAKYLVDSTTGYIRVNRFASTSSTELRNALLFLKQKGAKHLILDLQGNSGGYLNTAVQMADDFLDAGKKIVYTRGNSIKGDDYFSKAGGVFEKGKLIVLMNEGSASASEIFAGAMQDNDRGLLIGRKSYGKGLVQKPVTLPDGSQIRLTIARYYTPSGRCIQRPYDMEKDDYFKEYSKRMNTGQLMYRDSIDLPDSLKYFTANGRAVYAAGGIIPDVFVPIDTFGNSDWFAACQRSNLFNRFCLDYVDEHRRDLMKEYPDVKSYIENFDTEVFLWYDFLVYSELKKIEVNKEQQMVSKEKVLAVLRSAIANYLWDTNEYFEVNNLSDPVYLKALELMKEPDFRSYGIRP